VGIRNKSMLWGEMFQRSEVLLSLHWMGCTDQRKKKKRNKRGDKKKVKRKESKK
jgi:hypothetical protein